MNARIALLAVALTATVPAYASDVIRDLASETGLSQRRVQMILGCRTAFAEYPYTYDRSLARFKRALGDARYEKLIAGQPIEIRRDGEVRVVSIADLAEVSKTP